MKLRTALIPIAAFAVTVSTASAFNSDVLVKAGLTDDQINAFEESRELRESGDKEKARDVLVSAGIDEETMRNIRETMQQMRQERRTAIDEAVDDNDYDAFLKAIEGSPLADIIDTKAEFESFAEARKLMQEGDREAAKEIFDDLGLERGEGRGHGPAGEGKEGPRNIENAPFWDQLSSDQQAEIKTAMENHDHDKVKEILDEAGIEMSAHGGDEDRGHGFGPHRDGEDN